MLSSRDLTNQKAVVLTSLACKGRLPTGSQRIRIYAAAQMKP
jgi:hypothetical protein